MMKYKGYIGKVELDPEAGILHGEVVGIRDVVTFQGQSVAEVEKAFRDSVDDYLAFCKERNEAPDKPFSGHFVLRVGSELHRWLSMLAEESGKSLNAFVAECLQREVEERVPQTDRAPVGRSHTKDRKPRSARRSTSHRFHRMAKA